MENIMVRPAAFQELERVNEIRRYVNDVHVAGRPDIFRPGFCRELEDAVYQWFAREDRNILVAVLDGEVCGFASVEYLDRPESPYNLARKMYRVEEIGVAPPFQRRGVASALVKYMKADAARWGCPKIELDVWEFNQNALAFYERAGFVPYRRYLELPVE